MRKSIPFQRCQYGRLKLGLLAIAFATVFPQLASAEDLTQIYQQAREADPALAAAEANRNAVQENSPIARSALLPQINGSYGYSHSDSSFKGYESVQDGSGNFVLLRSDGTGRSRPASVNLSQSLFNWANIERWRGANAQSEGAQSTYDAASQDLLVRTATAYFGVLTAEDQLSFARLNEKSLQKQLDQAEQRFQVGLSAITDVHVARAQHDAAVAQVITAQNLVENAREGISQITGKSFGELKKLRDPLPLVRPEPAQVEDWVGIATRQSPLLLAAQRNVEAAGFNVSAQRAGHFPTLSGSVSRSDVPSWGSGTNVASGLSNRNSLSGSTVVGVTLNIPLFSGGLTTAQTRQAMFQRDAAQDQFELQRRTVLANTRNAYRAVIAGISEVEATKAAVVSAQSALDATQAGFEVGTKTIVDVLISQSTLLNAQSAYSQARHQFVLSGLQLRQAAGIVAAKDLEAVNALLQ